MLMSRNEQCLNLIPGGHPVPSDQQLTESYVDLTGGTAHRRRRDRNRLAVVMLSVG